MKKSIKQQDYIEMVRKFNEMYGLPVRDVPCFNPSTIKDELLNFKSILLEEINEVDEIILKIDNDYNQLSVLTDIADWLHDIIVYCSTKACSYGLPTLEVLAIIMNSNFSKLGEDGKPIYDARGKVLKGPDYWRPEPTIFVLLESMITGPKHQ